MGPVRIPGFKVEPSYQLTPAERAGPYLGTFTFGWAEGRGGPVDHLGDPENGS
jgi:hypothetical protein